MWLLLLSGREQLVGRLLRQDNLAPIFRRLVVVMITGAAIYGASIGSWHGVRLAFYDAIKLPLVLLLTSGCTVLFSWMAARGAGVTLTFSQVGVLTFAGLATTAVLLGSLTPIAWFFTWCAPVPESAARTTHNELYLMHTALVGACGFAGTRTLWSAMHRLPHPRRTMTSVYLLWVLSYAIVGGEIAWALRPFVGSVSPEHPVEFMRGDALHGNVYEFIGTDILPHLIRWISRI